MKPDGFCYAAWKPLNIVKKEHQLPAHPYFVVSAQSNGDFIAVAAEEAGGISHFYRLDHLHLEDGWQKTGDFVEGEVNALKATVFDKIFAFGVDKKTGHSLVATSYDEGRTWSQSEIIDGSAHYDSVAFSYVRSTDASGKDVFNGIGVATGRDGAIAITTSKISLDQKNGIIWKQTQAPSHAAKKVVYVPTGGTPQQPDFSFVLITDPADYFSGLLLTHDCATVVGTTTYSKDGETWLTSPSIFLTSSFPTGGYNSQALIHHINADENTGKEAHNEAFLTDDVNTNKDHVFSSPCNNLGDLAKAVSSFKTTSQFHELEALFDVTDFFASPYIFVGFGSDKKTGKPVSFLSPSTPLPANLIFYRYFMIEDLPQPFLGIAHGGVSLQRDSSGNFIKNDNGFGYKTEGEDLLLALGSDGTC